MSPPFHPLNKQADIAKRRRNLPHWTQPGCVYFATFRLADSMAQADLRAWVEERETWMKWNRRPWTPAQASEYRRRFGERMEAALDAGFGSCLLAGEDARRIVVSALRHFDGSRYALDEFVVMPNHVHVLVMPLEATQRATGVPPVGDRGSQARCLCHAQRPSRSGGLSAILHSWKSFTAKRINALLGRSGMVWLDENFDTAVRSSAHLEKFREYIRRNPQRARLVQGTFEAGRGSGVM